MFNLILENMVGFIYKYENTINHKVYIGQTTDLVSRKSGHKYKATFVKNKFYNAVRKYGWENFTFDVLEQIEADTLDELTKRLDDLEIQYIEEYNSYSHGYNSTLGGHCYRGKIVSEAFREYCRNRVTSEETRKKQRLAHLGKKASEETKRKLRELHRKEGFKNRDLYETKRNAGIKRALAKAVVQIDKAGNTVNTFASENEATNFIKTYLAPDRTWNGISHGVARHCKGITKKRFYYGFEWKFKTQV